MHPALRPTRWSWPVFGWFLLAALALYGVSLRNPFMADDYAQIVQNSRVWLLRNIPFFFTQIGVPAHDAGGIAGFYRPMMFSSYAAVYAVFRGQPWAFRFFQIVFHALNAALILHILRRFVRPKLALLAAVVFLVHPLNVETVVYIADYQDIAFMACGLGAIAVLLASAGRPTWWRVSAVAALLLVGSLYKETSAGFYGLVLLGTVIFAPKSLGRMATGAVAAAVAYVALRARAYNRALVATSSVALASMDARWLSLPRVLSYYFGKFLFPVHLAAMQQWVVRGIGWQEFWAPCLFVIACVAGLGLFMAPALRRDGDSRRAELFFLAWFFGGLLIHAQILHPLDQTVADRWFYFPMAGLLGCLAVAAEARLSAKPLSARRVEAFELAAGAVIIALCVMTIVREVQWRSPEALYGHDLKYAGQSAPLELGYGSAMIVAGNWGEAKTHYLRARELKADSVQGALGLGLAEEGLGDFDAAQREYKRGIAMETVEVKLPLHEALAELEWHRLGDPKRALATIHAANETYTGRASGLRLEVTIADELGDGAACLSALRRLMAFDKTPETAEIAAYLEGKYGGR